MRGEKGKEEKKLRAYLVHMKLRTKFYCYDQKIVSAERVCQLENWEQWAHKHSIICVLCDLNKSFFGQNV